MFTPEEDEDLEMQKEGLADLKAFARRAMAEEMAGRYGKQIPGDEPEEEPMPEEGDEPIPGVDEDPEAPETAGGEKEIDPELLKRILASMTAGK